MLTQQEFNQKLYRGYTLVSPSGVEISQRDDRLIAVSGSETVYHQQLFWSLFNHTDWSIKK